MTMTGFTEDVNGISSIDHSEIAHLGLRCSRAGPYLLMGNLVEGIGGTPHSMFGSYRVATKKQPQKAPPEAVSDQECGLPWFPLCPESGHPANQNFTTKVVLTSASTRRFD